MVDIKIKSSPFEDYNYKTTENLVLEREKLAIEVEKDELKLKSKDLKGEDETDTKADIRYNNHIIDYIDKILEKRNVTREMMNKIIADHAKDNANKKTKGRR